MNKLNELQFSLSTATISLNRRQLTRGAAVTTDLRPLSDTTPVPSESAPGVVTTPRAALRDFLEIPYDQLEELNLAAKEDRVNRRDPGEIREERLKYLAEERRIKAVTVCFTDLEGRMHMLDYDKKFLLKSSDNLTFDGSSVRGFSQQFESDLRLSIDWSAFYWLPSDVFTAGKVLVFGEVLERDGTSYNADMRSVLKRFSAEQFEKNGLTFNISNEIEGFLFKG